MQPEDKTTKLEEFDPKMLKERIKREPDRKIFEKVFDRQTIMAIHTLATKGLFDVLEYIVSTGKEAHVFAAVDVSGNTRAVKIFKKETTDFKKMIDYIKDDIRFKNLRKDRMNLVFAWTKKEYKNLLIANKAKLPVPVPLGSKENVIVMEFIGEEGKSSPRLKDYKPTKEEAQDFYEQVIDFVAKLYLAGLVHADLSEYNILVKDGELIVIDFAQALLLNHPMAKEYYNRDIKNLANYFRKMGLGTSFDDLYDKVKARKEELEK